MERVPKIQVNTMLSNLAQKVDMSTTLERT
jgi:hypothetical protein